MKGFELVKREDHWALYNEDGHKIASTIDGCNSKLSIKNCEAIENGYDLDKLADEYFMQEYAWCKSNTLPYTDEDIRITKKDFMSGAKAIIEILGDKKFSEDNMIEFAMSMISQYQFGNTNIHSRELLKESLPQQTEFDVKIVTELAYTVIENSETEMMPEPHIKLDADGCLILKRI